MPEICLVKFLNKRWWENNGYKSSIFIFNICFIIGLLFDFFRILRKAFKTADILTYCQDILFWILTGLVTLYSIFVFNNGEIRIYIFLGILIGIILYMLLLSKYIILINVYILNKIKMCIKLILKIIVIPFKFIFNIFKKIFLKPISFIFINIKKDIKKISKKMTLKNKNNVILEKNK